MIHLTLQRREQIQARFFRYANIQEGIECWLWIGAKYYNGYGAFQLEFNGERFSTQAHRIALYLFQNQDLYSNYECLHLCKNKHCVNPNHLKVGTHEENMQDMCKLTTSQIKEIVVLLNQHKHNLSQIATQFHVSTATISSIARNQRYSHITNGDINYQPLHRTGEQHYNHKLTEANVFQIRSMLQHGVKGSYIAKQFNISQNVISAIKHRKIWKNVYLG